MEKLKSSDWNMVDIRSNLVELLREKFRVNPKLLAGEYDREKLTGRVFQFQPRLMVYLLFEVERVFHIHVSAASIVSNRFNSIEDMVEVIREELAYHSNGNS